MADVMAAQDPVVRVTVMTHRGAVRPHNEDAVVVGAFTACGVSMTDPVVWVVPRSGPLLVAVADGMGGHAAGALASAHTVRSLAPAAPGDGAGVEAALGRVDHELFAMAEADPSIAGTGTTVVGVLLTAEDDLGFWAGDSRMYLEHGGYLAQVSVDDRGRSGGLTQCLGGRTDGSPLRVTVTPLPRAGRLLLCSDGLSDLVGPEVIEDLLAASGGPARVVKSLWAAAMNASGRDNITVVLVERDPDTGV